MSEVREVQLRDTEGTPALNKNNSAKGKIPQEEKDTSYTSSFTSRYFSARVADSQIVPPVSGDPLDQTAYPTEL